MAGSTTTTTNNLAASDVDSFDYVIVGGGTAGCVIASRLAQYLPRMRILVIEGGPSDFMDDRVLLLKDWLSLLGGDLDYDYPTVEQPMGTLFFCSPQSPCELIYLPADRRKCKVVSGRRVTVKPLFFLFSPSPFFFPSRTAQKVIRKSPKSDSHITRPFLILVRKKHKAYTISSFFVLEL